MTPYRQRRIEVILESFCNKCEKRDTCDGRNLDCVMVAKDLAEEEND